jgi:hypothetical protein
MDLGELGCGDVDWGVSGSGWGTVSDSCEHSDEPLDSIKFWDILE